ITHRKKIENLKTYLDEKAFMAYAEIVNLLIRQDEKTKKLFKEISRKIVKDGAFLLEDKYDIDMLNTISYFAEKEILFYDPMSLKVNGNNRTYEKGMEILLSKHG
ncbi:hypothetical protein, partial [Hydrogenobaculum acidophilum]